MKIKLVSILLALVFGLGAFAGCASFTQEDLKFAVQYAAAKVIANNPERSAKVVAVINDVKAVAGSENFHTVDLLMAYMKTRIDYSKFDAADRLLADRMVGKVGEVLKTKVGDGALTNDKLMVVNEVLGWIVEAAAIVPGN